MKNKEPKSIKIPTTDSTFEFNKQEIETIRGMREAGSTLYKIANALKFEEKIPLHIKIAVVNELLASKNELP